MIGTPPLFSIITVTRNPGRKMALTAASVLSQDCRDFEYIVIDACSRDGSVDFLRDGRLSQVHIISEPDRGIYDAMNKGVKKSRGRFIIFLGAGDLMRAGVLSVVQKYVARLSTEVALLYGDVNRDGSLYDGPFDRQKLCAKNICHQAILYGRALFDRIGEFDLRYRTNADWEFNMRCFGDPGVACTYIPLLIADYEGGGVSDLGDSEFQKEFAAVVRRSMGLVVYAKWRWSPALSFLINQYHRQRSALRRVVRALGAR